MRPRDPASFPSTPMMIIRQAPFRLIGRAKYSTEAYSGFKKLTALPFTIKPEEAQRVMAPIASSLCGRRNFFGSVVNMLFPSFGLSAIQPYRFAAVYFPAWMISGELVVDVEHRNDTEPTNSMVQFNDSYLPGSDFSFLSSATYPSLRLSKSHPIPFTEALTRQHGTDIQCIPYSVSPFSIFKAMKDLPQKAEINEDISFYPSSIQTDFFAAHPILVPLYLAQYHINEDEPEAGSITVFTEGFGAGYPMVANFSTQVPADELDPMIAATQFMGIDTTKQVFGMKTNVKRVEFAASYGGAEFDEALSEYLDEVYDKPGSISELASYGYLQNDNDPRIRPYTPEEAEAILEYLKPGLAGIVSIKINNSLQKKIKGVQIDVEQMGENFKVMQEEREKHVPPWWLEYKMSQEKPSSNSEHQ